MKIPRITTEPLTLEEAADRLRRETAHAVAVINWPDPGFSDAAVSVSVGYGGEELYLRYDVQEPAVLAVHTEPNSPVCRDSCVEFFFAPGPDRYINVEFNAIGTVLAGRGPERANREAFSPDLIARIRRASSLGSEPFPERREPTAWNLTAAVPLDLLDLDEQDLPGRSFRANFYKCGERLTRPHYLTWNPVLTPAPDFHRPEFFGHVTFAA